LTQHSDLHTEVVIVGGGLAGLACAVGLVDNGVAVMLLEASSTLGGRACSWTDPASGDVIDIGPHILLSDYPNMRAFLGRLGTEDQILWQTDKLIRLIDDDQSIDMYERPLPPPLHLLPSIAKVGSLSLRDKASNRRITWLAMQLGEDDIEALDALSAAQLLERYGVSRGFRDWFWASACMSLLNAPLEECSAGALMRVYAQLIARRNYRFGFPRGGLGDLYAPALRAIVNGGGRVHTRTRAVQLTGDADAVTGVVLADGARISAGHCVLAIPPQALATLAPDAAEARAFEPCPYVSIYLWLDRKLSHEKFWYRLWRPENLNNDFYDLSNIRTGWGERPSVIASNIIYSHRAHPMSDKRIIEVTRRELAEAMPQAANAAVLHSVVNRIPMAIPRPAPGTERKRPLPHTARRGLLLAGDWTRTGLPSCMESAVKSGLRATEAILCDIGRPRQLARPIRPREGFAGLVHRLAQRA
jgi:15-cis-phytoene desaturase